MGALDSNGKIEKSAEVDDRVVAMAERIRARIPASKQIEQKAPEVLRGIGGIGELEERHGVKGELNMEAA